MNRNRILHPKEDWQYITVPLSNSSISIKIAEAQILDKQKACDRILRQIEHYRKHALYFNEVHNLVKKTFERTKTNSLVELNVNSLKAVCEYLGINFNYIICSEEKFPLPKIEHAGQWSLEISCLLGASEYINPPGGKDLFVEKEFNEKNIKLTIQTPPKVQYSCAPYEFVESLSILDVLMWNSPQTVKGWL